MSDPLLAGGLAFTGSLINSSRDRRQSRRQRRANQRQFGINAAGIDFSLARQMSFIPEQVSDINSNKSIAQQAVNQAQAKTEAELRVSAAAAGVSGSTVGVLIGDTERTAAKNNLILDDRATQEKRQLEIDMTDAAISSELRKGGLEDNHKSSKGADIGLAGLDFLSKYLSSI